MALKQEQQKKSPLQLFQERADSPLQLLEEVRQTKIGNNGLTFEGGLDKIIENFRQAEFEFKKTNSFKQLQTAPSFVSKSWFQERIAFLENKETLDTFFEVLEVFSQSVEVVLGLDRDGNLSIDSDDFKDKKGEFISSRLLAPLSTNLEESFAYNQPFSAAFFTTLLTEDKSYLYKRMVEIAHNAIKIFKLEDEEKG